MYIESAYHGKSPKWLYLFFPTLFFGLTILSFLASRIVDMDAIMKDSIQSKGELRFFAENMLFFVFLCVVLLVWVRYVHRQPLVKFHTARTKIDWKRFFFSFFLWGGTFCVMVFANYLVSPEDFLWNFQPVPFAVLCLLSILLIPFQAGFEEYFFRGYLMQGVGLLAKNRWIPLLFTSIAFGLVHAANPEIEKLGYGLMVYYIGVGLFLGVITLMDDGLELALGFHISNNIFIALLITSSWSALQTPSLFKDVSEPSLETEVLFPLLMFFPLLLYIFAKKYGWQNWKEKLLGRVLTEREFIENQ